MWLPGQIYLLFTFWEGSVTDLIDITLIVVSFISAYILFRALARHNTQMLFAAAGLIVMCVIGTQVAMFMELLSYDFSFAESLDSITTLEFDPVNTPLVGYTMWLFQRIALIPGILAVAISAIAPHH